MLAERAYYDARIADARWGDDEGVIRRALGDEVYERLSDPVPLRRVRPRSARARRRARASSDAERECDAAASEAIARAAQVGEKDRDVVDAFVHLALAKMYFAARDDSRLMDDDDDDDDVHQFEECREHLGIAHTRAHALGRASVEAACWKLWSRLFLRVGGVASLDAALRSGDRCIEAGLRVIEQSDVPDESDIVALARDYYDVALSRRGLFYGGGDFSKAFGARALENADAMYFNFEWRMKNLPHIGATPYLKAAKDLLDRIRYVGEDQGTYREFRDRATTTELYTDVCLHLADVMENHQTKEAAFAIDCDDDPESLEKMQTMLSVVAHGYRIIANDIALDKLKERSIFDAECPMCARRVGGLSMDDEPVTYCHIECPRRHQMHTACYNSLGRIINDGYMARNMARKYSPDEDHPDEDEDDIHRDAARDPRAADDFAPAPSSAFGNRATPPPFSDVYSYCIACCCLHDASDDDTETESDEPTRKRFASLYRAAAADARRAAIIARLTRQSR